MSEYERLLAQKEAIVAKERAAIEQPFIERIESLTAQLTTLREPLEMFLAAEKGTWNNDYSLDEWREMAREKAIRALHPEEEK